MNTNPLHLRPNDDTLGMITANDTVELPSPAAKNLTELVTLIPENLDINALEPEKVAALAGAIFRLEEYLRQKGLFENSVQVTQNRLNTNDLVEALLNAPKVPATSDKRAVIMRMDDLIEAIKVAESEGIKNEPKLVDDPKLVKLVQDFIACTR